MSSSIWRKYQGSNQARISLLGTAGRFLPGFTGVMGPLLGLLSGFLTLIGAKTRRELIL